MVPQNLLFIYRKPPNFFDIVNFSEPSRRTLTALQIHFKAAAMFTTREDVIALLRIYPKLQRKVRLLEYERLHPPEVSQDEVINGLALSHPLDGGTSSAGHISDKTMQIALNFQDETDRLNYATVLEIDQELHILKNRIAKLEFYVEQLDKKQADVIRKYYFEEKTWPEIQKEMHISSRTLSKYRDDGLDALSAMGQYMRDVLKEPMQM